MVFNHAWDALYASHDCAIQQIQSCGLCQQSDCKVLDFGVGDGHFLQKLSMKLPKALLTGLDLSPEKLKLAKEKLSLNTIEANVLDANQHVKHQSQDIVLAHFINAYVPMEKIVEQAQQLTRPGGYFSLITTTYESFPIAQRYLADFINKESLLSRIVGHYYKAAVKNATVASDKQALITLLTQYQFSVLDHKRLEIPIHIQSSEELAQFGIDGTWFLNNLSVRVLPKHFLKQRLRRLFKKIFCFPYEDTQIINVILAKAN